MNPFQVVRDFEQALCEYTGAPYAVTTTSCTTALLLAVRWFIAGPKAGFPYRATAKFDHGEKVFAGRMGAPHEIEIPKRTYVGVPMSIIHAGGRPTFRDEEWRGMYQLRPLPVWDSARYLNGQMYRREPPDPAHPKLCGMAGHMVCLSFHWAKTLGIQQGGAILHDDKEADAWLRRARFDGRQEGVAPKDQLYWDLGWHAYMAPETAAAGLVRLSHLPRHNEPLPWDDYPDLSEFPIFK